MLFESNHQLNKNKSHAMACIQFSWWHQIFACHACHFQQTKFFAFLILLMRAKKHLAILTATFLIASNSNDCFMRFKTTSCLPLWQTFNFFSNFNLFEELKWFSFIFKHRIMTFGKSLGFSKSYCLFFKQFSDFFPRIYLCCMVGCFVIRMMMTTTMKEDEEEREKKQWIST